MCPKDSIYDYDTETCVLSAVYLSFHVNVGFYPILPVCACVTLNINAGAAVRNVTWAGGGSKRLNFQKGLIQYLAKKNSPSDLVFFMKI